MKRQHEQAGSSALISCPLSQGKFQAFLTKRALLNSYSTALQSGGPFAGMMLPHLYPVRRLCHRFLQPS
jgi:hypothetical protein